MMPFLMRHGYAVLFGFVLIEQAGLPIPAVPVLLAVGALAGMGQFSLGAALGVSALASVLADLLWYELGRRHGARILRLLCRIALEPDSCVRRAENTFATQGSRALILAKFVPGLSAVATSVAGLIRMRRLRFLLWDASGALLWAGAYLALGRVFSAQLEAVAMLLAGLGSRLVVLLGGALIAYILWKYAQRQHFIREIAIARITREELQQRLAAGEEIVIVDLRDSQEFEAEEAKLPGALHMKPQDLEERHQEIPRDKEVVLYCT